MNKQRSKAVVSGEYSRYGYAVWVDLLHFIHRDGLTVNSTTPPHRKEFSHVVPAQH